MYLSSRNVNLETNLEMVQRLYFVSWLYANVPQQRANQWILTQIEYLSATSERLANEYYL